MINRILFCFVNLMVRRKKMLKGCRKKEKMQKKVKPASVLTGIASYSH